jgi:MFS family permease
MASNGIALNTFNLYSKEFQKSLNIDVAKATSLAAILYLCLALPLPFVGRLLEIYSVKKLIIIGAIGTVVCLFGFSIATTYNQLLLFVIFYPLFLALTGLITSMYLINNWFNKYRGLATGILLMASSIGPALFAPQLGKWLATHTNEPNGWHYAARIEAIVCSLFIILPAILIYNHPKDKKTSADGIEGSVSGQPIVNKEKSKLAFNRAIKSGTFYLVLIVTSVLWFSIGGFIQNQRNYQADLQLDVQQSGLLQGLFFLCGLLGKIFFGWISDKYDVKKIMLLSVTNMLVGCWLLYLSLQNSVFIIPCAIVFGIGYSGVFTMIQLYILRLYNGDGYGKILGIVSFVDTLALSAGVFIMGQLRKTNGNYSKAFLLMIILTLFSLAATYFINKKTENPI